MAAQTCALRTKKESIIYQGGSFLTPPVVKRREYESKQLDMHEIKRPVSY